MIVLVMILTMRDSSTMVMKILVIKNVEANLDIKLCKHVYVYIKVYEHDNLYIKVYEHDYLYIKVYEHDYLYIKVYKHDYD